MSTPEQRAHWRRLEQAATPGEWWVGDKTAASWHGNELQVIAPDESPEHEVQAAILATLNAYFPHARQDAAFIAAARTAVPALLDDVERLEAEKHRRIYYQDIVYAVCNAIDALGGSHVGSRIVCGSADEPTREVQDAVYALVAETARLRAELREALTVIAGTPPNALWELETTLDYVTIQVDKPVYAAARKRLKELRCQEGSEGSTS